MALRTKPVTEETWADFERLFEAKGSPHYCWCAVYRFNQVKNRKAAMKRLVGKDTPVGVLAYDGDAPIGWCSVAPREAYPRLERSKTMPRQTDEAVPTWTVLCFFVVRAWREKNVTQALLKGAARYAKASGAKVLEGYPFDTAGLSSTHLGHSKVFRAARFRRDGKTRRW